MSGREPITHDGYNSVFASSSLNSTLRMHGSLVQSFLGHGFSSVPGRALDQNDISCYVVVRDRASRIPEGVVELVG
jgi:hypothetical protein